MKTLLKSVVISLGLAVTINIHDSSLQVEAATYKNPSSVTAQKVTTKTATSAQKSARYQKSPQIKETALPVTQTKYQTLYTTLSGKKFGGRTNVTRYAVTNDWRINKVLTVKISGKNQTWYQLQSNKYSGAVSLKTGYIPKSAFDKQFATNKFTAKPTAPAAAIKNARYIKNKQSTSVSFSDVRVGNQLQGFLFPTNGSNTLNFDFSTQYQVLLSGKLKTLTGTTATYYKIQATSATGTKTVGWLPKTSFDKAFQNIVPTSFDESVKITGQFDPAQPFVNTKPLTSGTKELTGYTVKGTVTQKNGSGKSTTSANATVYVLYKNKIVGSTNANANGKGSYDVKLSAGLPKGAKFTVFTRSRSTGQIVNYQNFVTPKWSVGTTLATNVNKSLGNIDITSSYLNANSTDYKIVTTPKKTGMSQTKSPTIVYSPHMPSPTNTAEPSLGYESTANSLLSMADKSTENALDFKTKYFLPNTNDDINHIQWANVQSTEMVGNYLYMVATDIAPDADTTGATETGRIIRVDMKKLQSLSADAGNDNGQALRMLATSIASNRFVTDDQAKVLAAIKVGPTFETGHGQGLAYNAKDGNLYLKAVKSDKNVLMTIDKTYLSPSKTWTYNITYRDYAGNLNTTPAQFNIMFDKNGNWYSDFVLSSLPDDATGTIKAHDIRFLTGTVDQTKNTLKAKMLPTIIRSEPSNTIQNDSYNPLTNQLHLVTNGAYYAFDATKLTKGTLKPSDITMGTYLFNQGTKTNVSRHWEDMTFDSQGYAYVETLFGSELFKSTTIETK